MIGIKRRLNLWIYHVIGVLICVTNLYFGWYSEYCYRSNSEELCLISNFALVLTLGYSCLLWSKERSNYGYIVIFAQLILIVILNPLFPFDEAQIRIALILTIPILLAAIRYRQAILLNTSRMPVIFSTEKHGQSESGISSVHVQPDVDVVLDRPTNPQSIKRPLRCVGINICKIAIIAATILALALVYNLMIKIAQTSIAARHVANIFAPAFWIPIIALINKLYGPRSRRIAYTVFLVMLPISILVECGQQHEAQLLGYMDKADGLFLFVSKLIGIVWVLAVLRQHRTAKVEPGSKSLDPPIEQVTNPISQPSAMSTVNDHTQSCPTCGQFYRLENNSMAPKHICCSGAKMEVLTPDQQSNDDTRFMPPSMRA